MLQQLKVEWLKIKYYRTFRVLSILYLISIFGANYISYQLWLARPKDNKGVSKIIIGTPFDFPDVWHVVSYISSFLTVMLGLLIIISVTNEYSFKTHRQNIIDGWSRSEFLLVKIISTVIIAFAATLVVFITSLLFGLVENPASFTFDSVYYILFFFIQAVNYCAVALFFSLLFKRSGITIGVYFLYSVILENMAAGFLNKYVENIGRYLPLEASDNLIRLPLFRVIIDQFTASYNTPALLIMSAIYVVLIYFACHRKFITDDV